jgi:hypothetical protein
MVTLMKTIFILFVWLCASISHAKPPSLEEVLQIGGRKVTLERFSDEFVNRPFWGEYVTESVEQQEFHFHFFPNEKFLVSVQCDLCTEVPIAEGRFHYSKSRLWLKYATNKGRYLPSGPLIVLHGYDAPDPGVDKQYEMILLDEKNYARAINRKGPYEYFRRRVAYMDWQSAYFRLKTNQKNHGKFVTPNGYPTLTPPKRP